MSIKEKQIITYDKDIVKEISREFEPIKSQIVIEIINSYRDMIRSSIIRGEKAVMRSIGTFYIAERKPKKIWVYGENKKRKQILINTKYVKFKPSKSIKKITKGL